MLKFVLKGPVNWNQRIQLFSVNCLTETWQTHLEVASAVGGVMVEGDVVDVMEAAAVVAGEAEGRRRRLRSGFHAQSWDALFSRLISTLNELFTFGFEQAIVSIGAISSKLESIVNQHSRMTAW